MKPLRGREYLRILPEEPFRIFFPIGLAIGVIGVVLWPLFYLGWFKTYPAVAHSRLMIGGFVGAFAIGFLGTAGPRMLGAPRLLMGELLALLLLHAGMVVAHLMGHVIAGDVLLLGLLSTFGLILAARVATRTSMPPPGMLLAAVGLGCAIAGAFMVVLEPRAELTDFRLRLARLLLFEGFLLLPIMGVGGFLFPRFFESKEKKTKRSHGYGEVIAAALCMLLSFPIDALGWSRSAAFLRAVIVISYLYRHVPGLFRRGYGGGTMAWCLRYSILAVLLGLVLAPLFPHWRVGLIHLLFVAGFGLMALTVAARALSGHAGELSQIGGKVVPMRWVLWLAIFAATTRVVADIVPKIRVSHHVYAALCWVTLTAIWAYVFLPKILRAEDEDDG